MIGTAGNEAWATGEWIETGKGKNGELITIKGYWSDIYVRVGDDWKIRVTAFNTTPDSVLLINKSFPPQRPQRRPRPPALAPNSILICAPGGPMKILSSSPRSIGNQLRWFRI